MTRSNDDAPPPKRRRVGESCKLCRTKKTRCDGQRPECSPCMTKNVVCEYSDTIIPVAAGNLADLETRVRRLEERAHVASAASPTHRPDAINQPATEEEGLHEPGDALHRGLRSRNALGERDHDIGSSFADFPSTRFLEDVAQIADTQPAASQAGHHNTWTIETDPASMVMPRRSLSDDLIDCYERYVYPLFPLLHMPTLRASYRAVLDPKRRGTPESQAEESSILRYIEHGLCAGLPKQFYDQAAAQAANSRYFLSASTSAFCHWTRWMSLV